MGLWDYLADETEKNTEEFMERTKAPVAQSAGSSLLGDIYSQQERAGKSAVEEAYNPAEDFTPVNATRKLLGKAGLAGLGSMMGAAGWVRSAPSEVGRVKAALKAMGPDVENFVLRSPKEYQYRLGDKAEAMMIYPPEKVPHVGGWSEEIPGGSRSVLLDHAVKDAEKNDPQWPVQATGHETGHHIMRELDKLRQDQAIPGVTANARYWQRKRNHLYPEKDIPKEIAADALAGKGRMADEDVTVSDPVAFAKWMNENIIGKYEDRKPLFLVDPKLALNPAERVGPIKYLADFEADQAKKLKYAKLDEEKQAAREAWKRMQSGGQRAAATESASGPKPHDELQDLLSQLGEPSPKVGTDLSLGGTLGEKQRPWTEIYKNTETGGGKYTPKSYLKPNEYDLTDVQATSGPGDMPDDVADYVMRKFTALHEDSPVIKEQKRGQLTKFMDWWQSASTDDRRMYSKLINQTAEKPAPPQPRSAPRYQEMAPQGGPDKKKLQNERLRLQNIAGLRKK